LSSRPRWLVPSCSPLDDGVDVINILRVAAGYFGYVLVVSRPEFDKCPVQRNFCNGGSIPGSSTSAVSLSVGARRHPLAVDSAIRQIACVRCGWLLVSMVRRASPPGEGS
jgi:hypothetical protein